MIGARDQLARRLGSRFSMNARQGRQAKDFVKLVHKLRAHHRHPDALVIQMGNNGPLYSDDMAAFHHYSRHLGGHLFLINDEVPVSWESQSNSALLKAAKEWPPHEPDQLAPDRRAQRLHLGRDPPDPEGRARLRAAGRARGARRRRPPEGAPAGRSQGERG